MGSHAHIMHRVTGHFHPEPVLAKPYLLAASACRCMNQADSGDGDDVGAIPIYTLYKFQGAYMRCNDVTDVIYITPRHVGGILNMNKDRVKKSDHSFVCMSYSHPVHILTGI